MKTLTSNQWYILTVVLSFVCIISILQIDSAWSDAHNFNGILGFLGIGIAFGLGAIFSLYKAFKTQF